VTGALSRFEFGPDPGYARRLMRRYAALFDRGPVADLGSGRGYFLEALRDRGIAGVGIDVSDEAIAHTRALGLDCIQQDVLEYLESAEGLAGIFAAHLIEHLEPVAAEAMIARASAALVRGGQLVIVTPNMADPRTLTETFWLDTTHVRPYPARLIAALMERHGLDVDEIGRGRTPLGRRAIPQVVLGRIRYGREYGRSEVFVRAHRRR
jgi:O-antigen chain-terminating methyltransferase